MTRYEYKLVATPSKSTKYKSVAKGDDVFAHTLMDTMNELAQEGWQFMRTETMIEERRSFWGGKSHYRHDYMVYRRALRTGGMSLQEPVTPQRVRRDATPTSDELRERLALVAPAANEQKLAAAS